MNLAMRLYQDNPGQFDLAIFTRSLRNEASFLEEVEVRDGAQVYPSQEHLEMAYILREILTHLEVYQQAIHLHADV